MATSVIHSVAGGTHERSTQPIAPMPSVMLRIARALRTVRIGKIEARLGNDNNTEMPSASLKLSDVVRCRMTGRAVSSAANNVRVCSARNAQRRGANHLRSEEHTSELQ